MKYEELWQKQELELDRKALLDFMRNGRTQTEETSSVSELDSRKEMWANDEAEIDFTHK